MLFATGGRNLGSKKDFGFIDCFNMLTTHYNIHRGRELTRTILDDFASLHGNNALFLASTKELA
jgi:hypothetical protein